MSSDARPGMANSVFSVAILIGACTERPTPPPTVGYKTREKERVFESQTQSRQEKEEEDKEKLGALLVIPLIIAMMGLLNVPMRWFNWYSSWKNSLGRDPPAFPASAMALTSPPAQKALEPVPFRMTLSTRSLSRQVFSSGIMDRTMGRLSALRALGRFSVMTLVDSCFVTKISSCAAAAGVAAVEDI